MDARFHLDHLMICVPGPSSARGLLDFGLLPGRSGPQPGTGASTTVFFFDDFYVEVAWPSGGEPAFADAPAMHFADRARRPGWCPFGVSFRTVGGIPRELPIATWGYAAPFLPPKAAPIPIGANSAVPDEPLLIVSLVSGRPDARSPRPPLQGHLGLGEVTKLTLHLSSAGPGSPELGRLPALVPVELVFDASPRVILEFDGGARGGFHAFGDVPLSFAW